MTPVQLIVRDKFIQGAAYAKNAIANETLRQAYKAAARPRQNAYSMAFNDAVVANLPGNTDTMELTL